MITDVMKLQFVFPFGYEKLFLYSPPESKTSHYMKNAQQFSETLNLKSPK
jgi:hypothetical protein